MQNDRARLYSLKKVKREVESRGKNFKAIGVPAEYKGKILIQFFPCVSVTNTLVCLLTSLPVHGQHDFAIRAFAHEL